MSNDNIIQLTSSADDSLESCRKICGAAVHKARVKKITPQAFGNVMTAQGIAAMFEIPFENAFKDILPAVLALSWEIQTRNMLVAAESDPEITAEEIAEIKALQAAQRPTCGIERYGFTSA